MAKPKPESPMTTTQQRPLNISIAARTVLMSMETVRAVLGVDADTINARIESGEIRWVWDVALGADVRELRFWAKEFIAPALCPANPKAVVAEILGTRERFRGTEIAQMLLVSRPTILRLVMNSELAGDIISGVIQVKRAALEKFLLTRLLENSQGSTESRPTSSATSKGGRP